MSEWTVVCMSLGERVERNGMKSTLFACVSGSGTSSEVRLRSQAMCYLRISQPTRQSFDQPIPLFFFRVCVGAGSYVHMWKPEVYVK